MKKVLLVILALCFAGTLALAKEATKPVDDKAVAVTPAVTSTAVVESKETVTTTETALTTEPAQDKTAANKDATEKVDVAVQN